MKLQTVTGFCIFHGLLEELVMDHFIRRGGCKIYRERGGRLDFRQVNGISLQPRVQFHGIPL